MKFYFLAVKDAGRLEGKLEQDMISPDTCAMYKVSMQCNINLLVMFMT